MSILTIALLQMVGCGNDHYGPLTSMGIDAPFVRKTADGDLYRPERR